MNLSRCVRPLAARRLVSTIPHGKKPEKNRSFLYGTAVGATLGLASALYITNYMLPQGPSPRFGSKNDLAKATKELQAIFPGNKCSLDEQDLIVHGSSSWFPMHNRGAPNVVVYPDSTEDVQRIARIATKYKIPIISYGAGTSIEGQFSTPYGGICVDFSSMDQIIRLESDDMTVTLGPGVSWQTLNSELDHRQSGLFFPVDPGPGATIGGCIGTSCSGPNAARYGTMKEWVLSMKVVTIDGEVFETRCKAKKSSTGYDMNRLMIGAEGTLGMVTEITLRLTNKPEHEMVGSCAFERVEDVTDLVMKAKRLGLNAQCLELIDGQSMPAINSYFEGTLPPYPAIPHLFFKLSGSKTFIESERKVLAELCRAGAGRNFRTSRTPEEAGLIWGARKNLLTASLAMHKDCVALSTDVCVPISKLSQLITDYMALSQAKGLVSSVLGHVGDGNFHSLILYDDKNPEEVAKALLLSEELCQLSLSHGGTVSGEHGVGTTKRKFMIEEYGATGIDLMQRIKDAWDPHGLLNPGKLLPDRTDLITALRKP